MNTKNPFAQLTRFEWGLWLCSMLVILLCFFLSPNKDILNTLTSLIGVTSLILLAKGAWHGHVLMIVFALLYGLIALHFRYWSEVLTYVGMTLPLSVISLIAWVRNPYKESGEVRVARLSRRQLLLLPPLAIAVTLLFFFLLQLLKTPNLIFSTLSITTSFVAAYLTFCRSSFFALGYAVNDVVLIALWVLATLTSPGYLPMVICFCVFLCNDLYGFFAWRKMQKRQRE